MMRKKSEISAGLDKYLNFCVAQDPPSDIQATKTDIVKRLLNFLLREIH